MRTLALVFAGLGLAAPAAAEPAVGAGFALEYSVPPGCPDEQAFLASIAARAPSAARAPASLAGVAFEVHITPAGDQVRGFVLVRLASGAVSRRDVPEASCREVAESIAAVAALVVDGFAAESRERAAPAPAGPVQEAPAPRPAALEPARKRAFRAPSVEAPPAPRAGQSQAIDFRFGLALGMSLESAAAPAFAPGFEFGAELWARRSDLFSPSARLSALYFASGRETTPDGVARFRLLAARVTACPVHLLANKRISLRPCAELDVGELSARGEETQNPKTGSMLWVAGGGGLRAELALGPTMALEAELAGRVLGKRARFLFVPDSVAYDVPRVSVGATLGVVGRLP